MEQPNLPLKTYYQMRENGYNTFFLRELERIDLCLQRYTLREYERLDSNVLEGFLLSDEEIAQRTETPAGVPHWLPGRETLPGYTQCQYGDANDILMQLVSRFELTPLETDILLLGLLPHFDSRYFHLFATLQRSGRKNLPSFELVQALFGGKNVLRSEQHLSLLPQSPLLKSQLITVRKSGEKQGEDWAQTLFLTATGIFHYLTGNDYLSPSLSACAQWYLPDSEEGMDSSVNLLSALQAQDDTNEDCMYPVLMLEGAAESGQLTALCAAASQRRQGVLSLDMTQLPEKGADVQQVLGEAVREVRMRDALLVLRQQNKTEEVPQDDSWVQQLQQPGLRVVILCDRSVGHLRLAGVSQLVYDMPGLTCQDKEALLGRALTGEFAQDIDIAGFCRRFSFTRETLPYILQEARGYRNLRDGTAPVSAADLNRALRMHTRKNFGKLAQRREPNRTFDDLVASTELREQLTEILTAARHRESVLDKGFGAKIGYGIGISALFCGDSGTGKTMAAEVIAGQLEVDLIKVDLSTVVNKYIGETEKNLSRIFDLAEADAGVLFFDEADALFGKRTAVSDAKDRNANIEVAYLLQRLENHPGLVILSTNNRNHLDDAFSRRFTFITRFDFPSIPLREDMWRRIWPDTVVLSPDINFSALASTAQLTGANIRNIALLSAWLAAEEATGAICDRHVRLAMKRELAKVGRIPF
jgi:ATP-dependent 26S proteasome regulatory subunit